MPHPPARSPLVPPPADAPVKAPPKAPRRDSWSLDKQVAFLRALSATHSVTEAAKSVHKSRQSSYRLRSKLKGKPFDLAWEVAFHHSYDVLAHAALDRALNGVEVPVYFGGEQVGSYRRFDERLTVALLARYSPGGNPLFGRLGPAAERHARDFEALLAALQKGEDVATGAHTPEEPGELEALRAYQGVLSLPHASEFSPGPPCPSTLSDDEIMQLLQEHGEDGEK